MAFENYTIKQFMSCWFKQDYTEISEEEFNIVYTEYIDTAGLFETEEFEKVVYIHFINGRINTVNIFIRLQREFIKEFNMPYLKGFELLKDKGYILKWNESIEDFETQLVRIEMQEKRYVSELENCIKELIDFRKTKGKSEEHPLKKKRENFIRTINTLGKVGYKIDRNKDTVEDLALMIKQQFEEMEMLNSNI